MYFWEPLELTKILKSPYKMYERLILPGNGSGTVTYYEKGGGVGRWSFIYFSASKGCTVLIVCSAFSASMLASFARIV